MSIPSGSNFPESLDTDTNLFVVHDSLRVRLAEDYSPGDTSITVEELEEGDSGVMTLFPDTGFITLTEQCSDIDERALTFYYTSKTSTTFAGLTLLTGFTDVAKPATITNVTQNVMPHHHNALKDALIAIQEFIGIEGTTYTVPGGATLEGRLNFLTKLVLTPRAWFTADSKIGLVPLTVTFTDESFRLGDGTIIYTWDFGDNCVSTISTSATTTTTQQTISVTSVVPTNQTNVTVVDLDGGSIQKIYTCPGIYDVTLTVSNENGVDSVTFNDFIHARTEAPDEAVVDFAPRASQDLTQGTPTGGPYTTPPKIRSATNVFINMEIPSGENPNTPGRSYGGELLDGNGSPVDPIVEYTWNLADDLTHGNLDNTRAAYSVGGLYDMQLRVDTEFGSYRITTYEDAIDIIEAENLWLWTFQTEDGKSGGVVKANEYGLTSETFKTASESLTVSRDDSFLDYLQGSSYSSDAESRAKAEFARNTAFASQGTLTSGEEGTSLMFWASGGSAVATQTIDSRQFNAFADTYTSYTGVSAMPWNWCALAADEYVYFLFGTQEHTAAANTNPANPKRVTYTLDGSSAPSSAALTASDFENGADTLLSHPSSFSGGVPTNGYFATYRTAWKDGTGYILRNSAVNDFFRLLDFFGTQGTVSNEFETITRFPDMGGPAKTEGQLVAMSNGVFFFNNSGEISAYNDVSGVWEVAAPSSSTVTFRSLQDNDVSGFDSASNRLLAASDGSYVAYLSYDYSTNAFVKFTNTDNTFSSAGIRPSGTQFLMSIY
jgi:PKD repeat protein